MKLRLAWWAGLPLTYVSLEAMWAVFRSPGLPLPLWFFLGSLGLAGGIGVLLGGLHAALNRTGGRLLLPAVVAAAGGGLLWKLSLVMPELSTGVVAALLIPLLVPFLRVPDLDRLPRGGFVLLLFSVLVSTDLVQAFGEAASPLSSAALPWVGSWFLLVVILTWTPTPSVGLSRSRFLSGTLLGLLFLGVGLAGYGWENTRRSIPWRLDTEFTGPPPEVELRSDRDPNDLPNILLISIDALRWDGVPPHTASLPHLNALRQDSVEFTRTISTSSWTRPAHASLFTGRLPSEHRSTLYANRRINSTLPTYTQYLRELGYHTAGFTGGGPLHPKHGFARGFDRYERQPVEPYEGFVPGATEMLAWWLRDTRYRFVHRVGPPDPDRTRHRAVFYPNDRRLRYFGDSLRRARGWLDGVRGSGRPWFLFLHTFQVHDYHQLYPESRRWLRENHPDLRRGLDVLRRAMQGPPDGCLESRSPRKFHRYLNRKLRDDPGPLEPLYRRLLRITSNRDQLKGRKFNHVSCVARATPDHWRAFDRLYHERIRSVDRQIGNLMQYLRRENLYDSTLILFVSDHGEGFALNSGAFVHGFGQLDDLLIRVPTWIKLPGSERRNERRRQLLEITDLFPMALDYLGLELSGRHPFMSGERANPLLTRSGGARRITRGSIQSFLGDRPRAFARGRRYKAVRTAGEDAPRYYRVSSETLSDTSIEAGDVPDSLREHLEASLREVFLRIREGRSPSGPVLPEDGEPPLKGLGYF